MVPKLVFILSEEETEFCQSLDKYPCDQKEATQRSNVLFIFKKKFKLTIKECSELFGISMSKWSKFISLDLIPPANICFFATKSLKNLNKIY